MAETKHTFKVGDQIIQTSAFGKWTFKIVRTTKTTAIADNGTKFAIEYETSDKYTFVRRVPRSAFTYDTSSWEVVPTNEKEEAK